MITLKPRLRFAATMLILSAAHCASQPAFHTPSQGTLIAEYRSPAGPGVQLLGVDLATDAMLRVSHGRSGAFDVSLRTATGSTFTGTAGAAVLIPNDRAALDRISLIQAFPFLLPHYLEQLPKETYKKETLPDGSSVYSCTLISGSVATTIRGLPEGFSAATQQVDYAFNPDGRLASITHHATNTTETLEYIDFPKDPKLAIPKSFAKGGWVLHAYEIDPVGRPDLFNPESVTARAREMLIAFNERQRELTSTPAAKRQLTESIEQLGGNAAPLRSTRFALILTGLIVIAVGSLAWWKNRS